MMNILDDPGDAVLLSMGDPPTFDGLFRAYFAPLRHFTADFLESDDDAKDVVEDLFVKLWQRKQCFENTQHAQAYLYRCARNACLNYLKHGRRVSLKYEILIADTGEIEEDYLTQMIRAEVWGEIYRAIENLPSQCSKVITMSYIDGNSNAEIADMLNLSLQTVKNHKVRGLHILKDILPGNLFMLLVMHSLLK
jgi:RNA polymerase sigma-70 factor (family 1)